MYQGTLSKMVVKQANPIEYKLFINNQYVSMNDFIGQEITIQWTGTILCMKCGAKTKTSFNQGFCFKCYQEASECSPCIIHPELCEAHLGKGRDIEWEQKNHNIEHVVYLASTDIVKVGITRQEQSFTRWIDQGANSSLVFAVTPNRYQAGLIEVAMKDFFSDKTNWRSMLTNKTDNSIDLVEEKWRIAEQLPQDISQFITEDDTINEFIFPVIEYPKKINSINLEKEIQFTKKLIGIRGQYLLFSDDTVINIRKYGGYQVILS